MSEQKRDGGGRTSSKLASVSDLLDTAVGALGGQRRDGQHAMAQAVAAAIGDERHLLVQAGTGTGKSLAYLVPAVRHNAETGERVVVSTATLALQRQIVTSDIPRLLDSIEAALPVRPQVALLKGRNNYLCLHKLAGGYPDEDEGLLTLFAGAGEQAGADHPAAGGMRAGGSRSRLGKEVQRLRNWAEQTETGDRDDLEPGVTPLAWRQVSTSALECLGQRCPMLTECFAERARLAAQDADLVVTNHAMLAIHATSHPVLPEYSVLIVDEAHELTDRVTSADARELSGAMLETAARRARRDAHVDVETLERDAAAFEALLADLPDGRVAGGVPGPLREAVGVLQASLREAEKSIKDAQSDEADGPIKRAQASVTALAEVAGRIVEAGDGDVVWRAGRFDDSPPALHIAPLQVAGLLRSKLLDAATTILTSATLALGGRLAPAAAAVGLGAEGAGEGGWRGLDVGSPFDYAKQAILFVAKDLPAPGRDGVPPEQHDVLAELIEAAGGGTLALFSSRRAAEAAAEAVRARTELPIYCQGEEILPALIKQFTTEHDASLFGTLSLWQGIDAPGMTCRLVTIDRIPFPRPDDPITSARAEAAGPAGFMTVSAAHAALLLAQGSGRLIRRTTDRGVVAVLDPRLVTKRYGGFLLKTMPPMWLTTDRGVVTGALRRLAKATGQADQDASGRADAEASGQVAGNPSGRADAAASGQVAGNASGKADAEASGETAGKG